MVEVAGGVEDAGGEAAEEPVGGAASMAVEASELLLMLPLPQRPVWAEDEAAGVARI